MLRYLIHLELHFAQGNKYRSTCVLLHAAATFGQHHYWKILSFIKVYFWFLYQK